MSLNKTLLCLALAAALVAGCRKQATEAPAEPEATAAESAAPAATAPAAEPAPANVPAQPQAAPGTAFDINSIPVSDAPLGAWPYIAPPTGYEFDDSESLTRNTKDLARVPVWTGGELLWTEGKVFTDELDTVDGKTYSKFEVRKGLQQSLEALGAKRVSERTFDDAVAKASKKELGDFVSEFSDMYYASIADEDMDTYVLRRADKVVWFEVLPRNSDTHLMVVESPLPPPATQ